MFNIRKITLLIKEDWALKKSRSAAVGAYQMLYPDRAARALGIDLNSKFDQETQDKLAEYYLNMAGQQDYLSENHCRAI